jgi:hypothetical protein
MPGVRRANTPRSVSAANCGHRGAACNAFSVKRLRDKNLFDEAFRPAFGRDVAVHVGNIGALHRTEVFYIINRKMAVLHVRPAFVLLIADTSNLLEQETADVGTAQIIGALEIARTNTGELLKVFVAKPFAVEQYLPRSSEGVAEKKSPPRKKIPMHVRQARRKLRVREN